MKRSVKIIIAINFLLAFLVIFGISMQMKAYSKAGICFGTVVQITTYGKRSDTFLDSCFSDMEKLDNNTISWRSESSEVSKINTAFAKASSETVSDETSVYLAESLKLCKDTNGALDITIQPLTELWGIETDNPKVPSESELNEALARVSYHSLQINGNEISSSDTDTQINLGAVGKGIACDRLRARFEEENVKGAVASVGGSILVYGKKPLGKSFTIAVQKPNEDTGIALGTLSLDGGVVVSTSGDYEKYFEDDGKVYHHILDPKTGYPADTDLSSVTVVAKDGYVSDGLSTACFVLGMDKSLDVLKEYNAEAVFVTKDKSVYVTSGLYPDFTLTDKEYNLKSLSE